VQIRDFSSGQQIRPALDSDFIVGAWRVVPARNCLSLLIGDLERQLEPRLMHLLCFLAANSGQVLRREMLVEELWPRVIVNENSLTRAVSELRKQLALPSHTDKYIETIPKKGYRLLPRIRDAANRCVESAPPHSQSLEADTSIVRSWNSGVAASLAVCLAVVLALWQPTHEVQSSYRSETWLALQDEVVPAESAIVGGKVTFSSTDNLPESVNAVEAPVLSNDGSSYAYIQYDAEGSKIYVGDLEQMTEPVLIHTSNARLYNLAWSPVGEGLIFARQPLLNTTALFTNEKRADELLRFDLNSMKVSKLIEDEDKKTRSAPELNLT